MSGWVAVLASSPATSVEPREADELAAAYVRLRGGDAGAARTAGPLGHAVAIPRTGEAGEDGGPPERWQLVAGQAIVDGDSRTAPLEDFDGQWSCIRFDERDAVVEAAVDAFGMSSLFEVRRGGRIYLSTSALVLASHLGLRPDPAGVLRFLRLGYQCGPATMWEGVRRFAPGERLTVTADDARRDVVWRPAQDRDVTALGMRDAARRLADVIVERSGRLRDEPAFADLTGGFDSRTMTLALDRAGVEFATSTNGEPGDADVEIAREIASYKGWRWSRIGPPPDWDERFRALVPRALAWGDGRLDVLQLSETLCGHDLKREQGPQRVLYSGGGIEHFRHYAWYSEFLRAGRTRAVDVERWVRLLGIRPMDVSIFAADPTDDVRRGLVELLRGHIEPYAGELNTVQADMLYAYKSTGHFGAYATAGAGHFDVVLPGYFKDVFTVAFSSSHRHRNAHRLNREVMELLDPRAAAIRAAIGGPATPMRARNAAKFWPYYATFARKGINKFGGLAGLSVLAPIPTNRGFVTGRPTARAIAVELLAGDGDVRQLRAARLLSTPGVEGVVASARAGDPSADIPLGRLLTVELALRAVGTEL